MSGVDVGVLSFKFGFKLEKIGEPGGTPLAQVITELVDQAKRNVVLIVDEVQQAITTDDGNRLLLSLKAARDAVNPQPGTIGHFIFVGTGSHRIAPWLASSPRAAHKLSTAPLLYPTQYSTGTTSRISRHA
ncbi:hypothetical protein [Massilia antarctica]|uniref:hypothetical protein n=1 Tax=Massilia antarctica TaxID=2765360 RepID=UPI0006BB5F44|nr:hypothetical protein [Massilia sp. H27-R4]MCY0914443.1 hypothetical protein [Massilia sp. H27-R4]